MSTRDRDRVRYEVGDEDTVPAPIEPEVSAALRVPPRAPQPLSQALFGAAREAADLELERSGLHERLERAIVVLRDPHTTAEAARARALGILAEAT